MITSAGIRRPRRAADATTASTSRGLFRFDCVSRSPGSPPPTVYWPPAVTSSSSAGKRVITSQPSLVTTSCSSIRAADQPSVDGQNVSSAKTMPSSIVSG